MPDLRQLAQPLLDRPPIEPTPIETLRRRARAHRVRRSTMSAVAIVVLVAVFGGLLVSRNQVGHEASSDGERHIDAPAVSEIAVGQAVDVATGAGSLWVPGVEVVRRVDPATNVVSAAIPVAGSSDYRSVTVAFGSVWVTDSGTGNLTRIDPTTNQVVGTIHLDGSPTRMEAAGGKLWVSVPEPNQPGGSLIPVDPASNRAGAPLAISGAEPAPFAALAASGKTIFAAWGTRLLEIDTTSRTMHSIRYTRTTPGHIDNPISVAVGDDVLYVATASGRIVELDRHSLAIRRTSSPFPFAQQLAFGRPARAGGSPTLWLLTQPSSVRRSRVLQLDPRSLRQRGRSIATGLTSVRVIATPETTWVANFNQGTLTRIDFDPRRS